MTTLNLLLRRMNQLQIDSEAGHLEDLATVALVGLLVLMTLAVLL